MLGPKRPMYRSEQWLRAVASLPCQICGVEGQTQAAHRNQFKGMSLKVDDCWTAALCFSCHADIDQGKELPREERRRLMDVALLDTVLELARLGKIKPA